MGGGRLPPCPVAKNPMQLEDPGIQVPQAGFLGEGWRSPPPPPPVVPASAAPSALAVMITVDTTLLPGGAAYPLPPLGRGQCGSNPQNPN